MLPARHDDDDDDDDSSFKIMILRFYVFSLFCPTPAYIWIWSLTTNHVSPSLITPAGSSEGQKDTGEGMAT